MNASSLARHPTTERYLAALDSALAPMPTAERGEVVAEISAHIDDALEAGRSLPEVLARLGSAEVLAQAYLVEASLNARRTGAGWTTRLAGLAGLLLFGSLPTLLLTALLGSVGVAFVCAGPLLTVSGLCGFFGLSLEPVVRTDMSPWQSVLTGPLLGVMGAVCLAVLYYYLKGLMVLIRRIAVSH